VVLVLLTIAILRVLSNKGKALQAIDKLYSICYIIKRENEFLENSWMRPFGCYKDPPTHKATARQRRGDSNQNASTEVMVRA
jgi:hypothetical protein